jgi:hypothetical protein
MRITTTVVTTDGSMLIPFWEMFVDFVINPGDKYLFFVICFSKSWEKILFVRNLFLKNPGKFLGIS